MSPRSLQAKTACACIRDASCLERLDGRVVGLPEVQSSGFYQMLGPRFPADGASRFPGSGQFQVPQLTSH